MKGWLLSLLLVAPALAGPATKFPEQIKAGPPPAYLVRVYAYDEEEGNRNSGTGTLILSDIVVTASHVVAGKDGAKVEILFFTDWEVVNGTVIKVSRNDGEGRDVAVIKLDKPRSEPPLPIAKKANLGSVIIAGFSHGPYTEQTGTYYSKDQSGKWGIIRGAQARNGDSGGPVVQGGMLAGILWGSSENTTWFTPIEFLYELYPDILKNNEKPIAVPKEEKDDAPRIPILYSL